MEGVRQKSFGCLPDRREARLFEFSLGKSLQVTVSDFGASLIGIACPDRAGRLTDVVLGCGSVEEQASQTAYLGAIIGRVAGRISNASFSLNGRSYALSCNEGRHHLHGGTNGFSHRLWEAEVFGDGRCGVQFSLTSDDGDQGYPGEIICRLGYEIIGPGQLALTCDARSNSPTPFNPTSHAYINLEGHAAGSIADHWLQIHAGQYAPVNPELIPAGLVAPVAGTPFDFSGGRVVSAEWSVLPRGYDICFVLDGGGSHLREVATLVAPRSGRRLTVATDRPCLHLYTGGWLSVPSGKGSTYYGPFAGLSLEAQGYPDALNHADFPDALLVPDRPFRSQTIFQFDTEGTP